MPETGAFGIHGATLGDEVAADIDEENGAIGGNTDGESNRDAEVLLLSLDDGLSVDSVALATVLFVS